MIGAVLGAAALSLGTVHATTSGALLCSIAGRWYASYATVETVANVLTAIAFASRSCAPRRRAATNGWIVASFAIAARAHSLRALFPMYLNFGKMARCCRFPSFR